MKVYSFTLMFCLPCNVILRRIVAEPEMARVVNEFLRGLEKTEAASQPSHNEDKPGKTVTCGFI